MTCDNNQSAVFEMLSYQARYIMDNARLKGWVKARQIGGSTAASVEVARDAMRTGEDWNLMSRSRRQAAKLLKKVGRVLIATNHYLASTGRPPVARPDDITTEKIILANGAEISAMPCDPDTTVGDSCNWLLDEFALFPHSDMIFGVIKPSIRWGKKIRVLSTPRGRRNKFAQLWREWKNRPDESGWSWHSTNIEQAVSGGCPLFDHNRNPISFQEFKRQEIADIGDELWLQEYMCVFSDKTVVVIPYRLVQSCSYTTLPLRTSAEGFRALGRELFVGVDVGRKHDLTVIWVISRDPSRFTTRSIQVLDREPFAKQRFEIEEILRTGLVSKCLIDETQLGCQLAEELATAWPGVVEGITFTNALKDQMASRIKARLEAHEFIMPYDDDVLDDFNSVEKSITPSGNVVLSAPTSEHGHADRFWSAALALHGALAYEDWELVMA